MMRKIIVGSFISMDGVVQAPGGPEDGFPYSGWSAPYYDEALDKICELQKNTTKNILLGRKTYEAFASFFPGHEDIWPGVNDITKYVLSRSMEQSSWKNTVMLRSVDDIRKLKNSAGPDLQVHGSGNLVQSLLRHDLIDEIWLLIHPVTIGTGNRLFEGGTTPASFALLEISSTPGGVIAAHYKRSGDLQTGTFGA